MKAAIRWCAVLTIMVVSVPGVAGTIGFVDAERAVTQVDEGRAKIKQLEDWATPRRQRLEQMAERVRALQSQIQAQRMVAQPEVLQSLNDQERQARRELEDSGRAFERELGQKQDEFLGDVAVKVGTVASDYGKANNLEAIFVLKAQPLIYIAEGNDLTDIVIRMYNERFPVQ